MKRMKRYNLKCERPETSTAHAREPEEHDLAFYIHDRVELMHQVFSVLKPKDLKTMAPECIRHISIDDLQELCLEELLGISSKRLCAILDGAEPPSDTESSGSQSPVRFETISLDSISSDEELLSDDSNKKRKKHKHRRRDSKSKSKHKKKSKEKDDDEEQFRASRAGLTVLELLELQARARAIRAQLQQEQANKQTVETPAVRSNHHSSSENEVEIKEEPAEVVEISSEEEKPDVAKIQTKIATQSEDKEKAKEAEKPETAAEESTRTPTAVTKRINDLVITVPRTIQTKKIKLNRNKVSVSLPNSQDNGNTSTKTVESSLKAVVQTTDKTKENIKSVVEKPREKKSKDKPKKKQKKKEKKQIIEKDSDQDEITLQLSDTEKMDLLEDLDRKTYYDVTSDSSINSNNSSESESDDASNKVTDDNYLAKENKESVKLEEIIVDQDKSKNNDSDEKRDCNIVNVSNEDGENNSGNISKDASVEKNNEDERKTSSQDLNEKDVSEESAQEKEIVGFISSDQKDLENSLEISRIDDIPIVHIEPAKFQETKEKEVDCVAKTKEISELDTSQVLEEDEKSKKASSNKELEQERERDGNRKESEKELSEGEISDHESSEVEAIDQHPEVVCISDEDTYKNRKKKKKKDKKPKKEKKLKKSKSDFRENSDHNFHKHDTTLTDDNTVVTEVSTNAEITEAASVAENSEKPSFDSDDDIMEILEILELSDDSCCYEVEGTVLSKEPTAEEIEALSAEIDELEKREEVITDEQIKEYESKKMEKENIDILEDNISWKDRYLDSKKVKKILNASNIFNALRKKNKELKKKIEEERKRKEIVMDEEKIIDKPIDNNYEEGTIEHYNTLQGSTKYVDPVKEIDRDNTKSKENNREEKIIDNLTLTVTGELKKDAKRLLKMYKRLLKYNDMSKQSDPKKKKRKKSKDKKKEIITSGNEVSVSMSTV